MCSQVVAPHGPVAPGRVVDVSVQFHAPKTSGEFSGSYRLQDSKGWSFGHRFWVCVCVSPQRRGGGQQRQARCGEQAGDNGGCNKFKYERQLSALREMGIKGNCQLMKTLLNKNDGDVELVVQWLLKNECCTA